MRLVRAMLFVRDLEAMTLFYRDVIGFQPIESTRQADWIEFETGGQRFALHAIPAGFAEAVATPNRPAPRENAACKLVLAVDDAAAEMERLSKAGVTILARPWGGWDAVDPEGNVIGISQE